jgi:hypothetical protein
MKCPVCNAELPSTAKFCGGCGTTLTAPPPPPPQAAPPPPSPAAPSYEQTYPVMNSAPGYSGGGPGPVYGSASPAVKKKYKVLRLIAVLIKIFAVLAGVVLIIGGLVTIVAGLASGSKATPAFPDTGPAAFLSGAVVGLVMLAYGVFIFIFLYAYAEWMYVFMDIEENTRATNEMLAGRR